MLSRITLPALLLVSLTLSAWLGSSFAADPDQESASVFPEGRPVAGKTLFVEKGCYQCHSAGEVKMPLSDLDQTLVIELGGKEYASWNRDQFARAIMNPNHTVSENYRVMMLTLGDKLKAENTQMPSFNDLLTVSDLIHLTTFLDSLSK